MEQDPESEGESDDFSRKVASCLGRPVEVLMGNVSDPNDDPNTSKAANGEEKTPEAGHKKVDFVPALAPLKGTSKLPADGGNNVTTTGYLTQKGFEEKIATYEEILTRLPPDAPLQDIEKRHALLVEQATKITERELDLTNKEMEFLRKQREEGDRKSVV